MPEILPTEATDWVARRMAKGETIPIPTLGGRNSSIEATSGPLRSPSPASTSAPHNPCATDRKGEDQERDQDAYRAEQDVRGVSVGNPAAEKVTQAQRDEEDRR